MRVIGQLKIDNFFGEHLSSKQPLLSWVAEAEGNTWGTCQQIKEKYKDVELNKNNKVVFSFKEGQFRLEALVVLQNKLVIIERVGTYEEYSNWDNKQVA